MIQVKGIPSCLDGTLVDWVAKVSVEPTITLGVDPGTALLGYGVIAGDDAVRVIDFGVLETTPDEPMPKRLQFLYAGMCRLIQSYHPDTVVVEQLFFARNVTTALAVGQARGVVMLAAAQAGVPVNEYTPAEVKQAVSGYGRANKSQMQEMVRMLLGLEDIPRPDDAADALAVALCHVQTARFRHAVDGR
ncbi:Crossover junction endodeoxyribonuclease ruvC [Nitrolancea hollandica Lb]|uniref:Crossover junction endodeoxyribonuclease RuvC n=1 Tax=Nitrolancea hollandica Lb TaxID=1129897 RepID=I4ECY8_9BACT|nr:Crossover junction endodeoxyribonuclease ruvC [Nitrolancea hollandica Lb]